MDRDYADAHYSSAFVEDRNHGVAGQELYRTRLGKKERVARILFWDATGQFAVETFNCEVPLEVLEELVAEAKETIRTK